MTRTERQKLKRKIKRQQWTAFSLLLFGSLFLISIFVTPLINIFRAPEGTELTDAQMLIRLVIMFVFTVLPMFASMSIYKYVDFNILELKEEKNRLYKKQLRMYVEWFVNAIVVGDYKRAIDIHNAFIWGEVKSLTRGILIGFLFKSGDVDEARNALKQLSQIADEVYSEKI